MVCHMPGKPCTVVNERVQGLDSDVPEFSSLTNFVDLGSYLIS